VIADLARDNPVNRILATARRVVTDRRVVVATAVYAVYQTVFTFVRLA